MNYSEGTGTIRRISLFTHFTIHELLICVDQKNWIIIRCAAYIFNWKPDSSTDDSTNNLKYLRAN